MNVLAWSLVGYLAGANLLLVADMQSRGAWHLDELAALIFWPAVVPVLFVMSTIRHKWHTCSECKLRWSNRESMLRHRTRTHGGKA